MKSFRFLIERGEEVLFILLILRFYHGTICSCETQVSQSVIKGKTLSEDESGEINKYVRIFREFNCTKHHEVNEIISREGQWDNFKTIRSLNDHGEYKKIEGIQPQYFEIICNILKISGERGIPLDKYQKY